VFVFSSPAVAQVGLPLPVPLPESTPQQQTPTDCRHADAHPLTVTEAQARDATLCLLNRERATKGRGALRANGQLETAATAHAGDMIRRRYFAHHDPDGHDFVHRILRARYIRKGERVWILGENLAWGTGSLATPREIVRSWMNSSDHREIVLNRRFRDLGIGVVAGSPLGALDGAATYASEYGARPKR
jgi:uncharacterized protein YkwD